MSPYQTCKTAEDVFRQAKKLDPKGYAALEEKHAVANERIQDRRLASGESDWQYNQRKAREHREDGMGYGGSYVPKHMRRRFADAEWAATKQAAISGREEHRAYFGVAKGLADDGLGMIHALDVAMGYRGTD